MTIYVMMKNPSALHKQVKAYPVVLSTTPHTLRELIAACVDACITAYRNRAKESHPPSPLSDEEFAGMEALGKFAFGVHDNDKEIDRNKAVTNALQAVEDGLVRIFKGGEELTELDGVLDIAEGETLTFVRLTMLTGTFF
jgi:hypothetical protein